MARTCPIRVLTGDRDLGSDRALAGIETDTWLAYGPNIEVCYLSPKWQRLAAWKDLFRGGWGSVVYLNSMFSFRFTILPLWALMSLGWPSRIVLAPRGMLRESALAFKPLKKRIFLWLLRHSGLAARLYFHATDAQEAKDIQQHLGVGSQRVFALPNFPPARQLPFVPIDKQSGQLRLLFLGRVHPVKNLLFLLDILKSLDCTSKGSVSLTICGPIEDAAYYTSCKALIDTLPKGVNVVVLGEQPHETIGSLIKEHHLMVLPTLGENFGHAIFESWLCGRPVLISDQTPWQLLEERNIGYALPLNQRKRWQEALVFYQGLNQGDYDHYAITSWEFARDYISNSETYDSYCKLFANA